MRYWLTLLALATVALFSFNGNSQSRKRPDSMKHTDEDVQNMRRMDPVNCTYVSNGHVFYGDVYAVGDAGRIKIGTSTMTLSGGRYKISFTAGKFEMRDVLPPQDKGKYNPWRMEKLYNDFTQSGKFSTFKKAGNVYLRLHIGDSKDYLTDVPLSNVSTKSFVIDEEGLLFEYTLK